MTTANGYPPQHAKQARNVINTDGSAKGPGMVLIEGGEYIPFNLQKQITIFFSFAERISLKFVCLVKYGRKAFATTSLYFLELRE